MKQAVYPYLLAAVCVGAFSTGASAQANPPGAAVPPNTPGIARDPAQQAGEAKKNMRPLGVPRPATANDTVKTPEGGAIGTDRAAVAGEARAETRDTRRPGKAKTQQGGTPK